MTRRQMVVMVGVASVLWPLICAVVVIKVVIPWQMAGTTGGGTQAISLVASTMSDVVPAGAAAAFTAADDDDIRVAVFRELFVLGAGGEAYYVAVEGNGDPSDALVARLAGGGKAPVRKVSECTSASGNVRDKKTGKFGVILRISTITHRGNVEADVRCEWYASGVGAAWYVFTLRKEGGQWRIVEKKLKGIS